ncbi:hypothetical protein [Paramuribaculum intestinale]|uniref:hypothetical protein n=1 Tax=Paramuribaculum intestinale TaxID=2094151 RepID=UPI0025B6C006|nr:hypothetical protein [Paramuribaculum intestinale]
MGKVKITDQDLATSARTYRKDLLMVPVHALAKSLQHMTLRTGVRHSEKVGELTGDIEMGPYSETRVDDKDVSISTRELKTYLGSVVKKFSPNSVAQTVYGSSITKGESLTIVEIVRLVLSYLSAKIGAGIDRHLFNAVRKADGNKTVDLFDGFDTITGQEITSGSISTDLGNLYEFSEPITKLNAVDQVVTFCRSADDFLQETEGAKLLISRDIYNAYVDDYKATTGAIVYNDKFLKTSVEGFDNVELVPMYQKKNAPYIQLTTKSNLLVGVDQEGDEEDIVIEKHAPFVLDFVATMFFGTQFETLDKTRLLVGKLAEVNPTNH